VDLKKLFLSFAVVGTFMVPSAAQSPTEKEEENSNAVERIEEQSMGNVEIDIPDNILQQILREEQRTPKHSEPVLRPGINKMSGFRIQVFGDGYNQQSLESRARARGNAIVAKFPKYRGQVYSYSSSPNWYTRVGNFRTSAEASAALSELKRAFPKFAAEMRVVKSQIVVIK